MRAASLSADFALAYAQVIQLVLDNTDVSVAERLDWLRALERVRPEQPHARRLIERLGG